MSHGAWVALAADLVRLRKHRVNFRLARDKNASEGVTTHSWLWKGSGKTTLPHIRSAPRSNNSIGEAEANTHPID
jgi:hypothetical protein